MGPHPLIFILFTIFSLVRFVVIAQAIMSLLVAFGILNTNSLIVYRINDALNRLTEPMYRPLRRYVPIISGIDLSPIVILVGLSVLEYTISYYFVWN